MLTRRRKRNPSGRAGNCTWNADSTLASYPGPGYTRKLSYDEEGRLTKIDRDNGTTITPVFEYGYGFDGNRRWRKDLAGNTWDWYPCGVACCAGELVTMRSTNGGSTWSGIESRLGDNITITQNDLLAVQGGFATSVTASGVSSRIIDRFQTSRAGALAPQESLAPGAIMGDEGLHFTRSSASLKPIHIEIKLGGFGISFNWSLDCFWVALKQGALGALSGCIAGMGKLGIGCLSCIAGALIFCVTNPPLCAFGLNLAGRLCCSGLLKQCLAGAGGAAGAAFMAGYRTCMSERYGVPAIGVVHPW